MELVLLDTMYKIPSLENVSKVIIDAAVIEGDSEPLLMYENIEQQSKSAADE
jgi:ATP-dependent Clp protease ATP-binding subunit ClpX